MKEIILLDIQCCEEGARGRETDDEVIIVVRLVRPELRAVHCPLFTMVMVALVGPRPSPREKSERCRGVGGEVWT